MTEQASILVIEDDPDVATLLHDLLEVEGHLVDVAPDGLTGLVALQGPGVDVVLLDIMMPDIDGHRVLSQMVEEGGGTPVVPVIVVTGSRAAADQAREVIGSANVFEKPFDPDALMARVRECLDAESSDG